MIHPNVQSALVALDFATCHGDEQSRINAMRELLGMLGDPAFVTDDMVRDRLLFAVVRRVIVMEAGHV